MLRTIIVEDEPLSRMYLCNLLAEGFPDLEITGTASAEEEALDKIAAQKPDLVFLDIELQIGTGLRVATHLQGCDPVVVFTTALDELATNLLRITGVPYIQKPIDADTLAAAVHAAREEENCAFFRAALGHLREAMQNGGQPQSLLLPGEARRYVPMNEIVAIVSEAYGSRFLLERGSSVVSPQPLRELDGLLSSYGFFRAHMQSLIRLSHVKSVSGESVAMQGGLQLPVSAKRLAALQELLGESGPLPASTGPSPGLSPRERGDMV